MGSFFKKIKIKDFCDVVKTVIALIFFPFVKLFLRRRVWIVTERETEAKDNGIWFYKYAVEKVEDSVDVYYAIKKNSYDYAEVAKIGKILEFGSIKHFIYTLCAEKYISSQFSNGLPGRVIYYLWIWGIVKLNFYFLQHGVTANKSKYLQEPSKRAKLFCCVSDIEAQYAVEQLGYSERAAKTLGFCRYDGLKNQSDGTIFIMFTWRKYLAGLSDDKFMNTPFFRYIQDMLKSEAFVNASRNYKVSFVLHPGIAKYQHLFCADNVEFLDIQSISFQEYISKANLFITDYSSVSFDFAYLGKPVIYYQFDKIEFRENHIQEGYFDYEKDGFGPVCDTLNELEILLNNFSRNNELYDGKRRKFFKYFDSDNSERIFDFISSN